MGLVLATPAVLAADAAMAGVLGGLVVAVGAALVAFVRREPPEMTEEVLLAIQRMNEELQSARDEFDRELQRTRDELEATTKERDKAYQDLEDANSEKTRGTKEAKAVEEKSTGGQSDSGTKKSEASRAALLEKSWGPRPSHLPDDVFSVAFTGRTGTGKTSLWNEYVKLFFLQLVPTQKQNSYISSVPRGEVGIVETTKDAISYTFPETYFAIADIPGHGTSSFPTSAYVRELSIGYYDMVLYVYADRLNRTDVDLMLNYIMYQIPFRLVRQKFHKDLVGCAENEFRVTNEVTAFNDRSKEMAEYVQTRVKNQEFISKTKKRLHEELIKNWTTLLDAAPASVVQLRKADFISKMKDASIFYCLDSNHPEKYDSVALLGDIKERMIERGSKTSSVKEP
ncbi:Interferon-gamma-inducible GTPase [Seminavis robusta]|uniref:Interferon-gamma-inducible GTPase n=1 Tax=Seminavis robusta TaxID=568900 RepID=A0A9N8HP37_9STRA|nr:Interferon-gamma-inducible GTPase [Seminavis robusta]|eukprot:Sro870_g213720.1 Interferon-gamma-inducible GTPase (398) ;mRNA; f:38757-39950